MKKKIPAIAFDFTGVFATSNKALPNSLNALQLLQRHKLPFVILTNAGGRTDNSRAAIINKILETGPGFENFIN